MRRRRHRWFCRLFGWVDPLEQADQVSGTDHEAGQAVIQYLVDWPGLSHSR
ncbi:hypothetical protein LPU83_pLPU83c_0778 (plasmid) [Rhizobium favelukesii]|uniref:Uncharacterized protein n=1 Tax=Rhizobium favelukesii TaxID=348824 RepID=W6RM80_9HYPH|nr:hypothetical protein LPU83_pLPU83c_0778 [Rhizobium favelukesii]